MNNYDPKTLEAWFRFMAEATKSSSQASEMLERFAKQPSSPQDLSEVMKTFMPTQQLPGSPEMFNEWAQLWLNSVGMVPKSRYDALEKKYTELKRELESAERTIASLRGMLGVSGQEEQAKQALNTWNDSVQSTLKAQTEWWRKVMAPGSAESGPEDKHGATPDSDRNDPKNS